MPSLCPQFVGQLDGILSPVCGTLLSPFCGTGCPHFVGRDSVFLLSPFCGTGFCFYCPQFVGHLVALSGAEDTGRLILSGGRLMWKPEHRQAADRNGLRYPSDLTDAEWAIVEPMIPPAKGGGRRRSVNVREVLNWIF